VTSASPTEDKAVHRSEISTICIDARLSPGLDGGVEFFVLALVRALAELDPDREHYVVLANDDQRTLLEALAGPTMEFRFGAHARRRSLAREHLRTALPSVRTAWRKLSRLDRRAVTVPPSGGRIEAAGAELVHFPKQSGVLTEIPSIYQPWDLQHLHFPQFFSPRERLVRDSRYRRLCKQAAAIVIATHSGKRDLIAQYGLPVEKIHVIPVPPAIRPRETNPSYLEEVKQRLELPDRFLFYPAQTWPHKNHLNLLEALAELRRAGKVLPLVCSGRKNEFFPAIRRRASELGLSSQVHFVGFVGEDDVGALFALCDAVAFPSLFEGWGLPVSEAFSAGAPVACSNIPVLLENAGGAAAIFDPQSIESMAGTLDKLWSDVSLRRSLIERGRERVASLTWSETACSFRALYRFVARQPLTEGDWDLLTRAGRSEAEIRDVREDSRRQMPRPALRSHGRRGS
jgi:glycosyltransferase involved in cell wall biosynthesis